MRDRVCTSLGSGLETGRLERRPVHLLLMEGVLGKGGYLISREKEGALKRIQRGDSGALKSFFFLQSSPNLTLQRNSLEANKQVRDQRQVSNGSGAKEKEGWRLRRPKNWKEISERGA